MDGNQVQMIDPNKDKDKQPTGVAPAGVIPSQPGVAPSQPGVAAPQPISQPSVQPAPALGAGMQPQQAKPASKGTGFVGIRRLLGASSGSRLGQQVGGRVQQAGQQARAGITGARQQFQEQAGRAGQEMEQQAGIAKQALSGILSGTGYTRPEYTGSLKEKYENWQRRAVPMDFGPGSAHDAAIERNKTEFLSSLTPEEKQQYEAGQTASFMPTAEQQSAFQRIGAGQYTGPAQLAGAEQLASKAYEAQQLGKLAGSAAGRQELLQQQFGARGGYGSKLGALDALILGKTGGKQLAQARAGAAGLEKELATGQMAAGEQAKALQARAAGLSKDVTLETRSKVGALQSDIEKRVQDLQNQQTEQYQKGITGLQSGYFEKSLAEQLGLKKGEEIPFLSEQMAKDLLSKQESARFSTAMTQPEYAKLQALKTLTGNIPISELEETLGKTKQGDVGAYKTPISLNKERLSKMASDYQSRKQELENRDTGWSGREKKTIQDLKNDLAEFGGSEFPKGHPRRKWYDNMVSFIAEKESQNRQALESEFGGSSKKVKLKPDAGTGQR